jgi:hypothetical protein
MIIISNKDREEIVRLLSVSSEIIKEVLSSGQKKKGRNKAYNTVRRIGIISRKLNSKKPIKNEK